MTVFVGVIACPGTMSTSTDRWKRAKMASAGLNVTRHFRTLREMGADGGVPFDQLEFVCALGGAAH